MVETPTQELSNLGLDLVRVTEAAALEAVRWMGLGEKQSLHEAAITAAVKALNNLDMKGRVVIGEEGRLKINSLLDTGAEVGNGRGPEMDVIVDPIDGTSLVALGQAGALSVIGVAPRGSMWIPGPGVYMEKIVVNREVADKLVPQCLDAPAAWTLALIARAKNKEIRDLVVFVLNRPRHKHLINEIRAAGARVWLQQDGDVSGALLTAYPDTGVDVMMGVGGVMEGILSACAVKSLGGAMLGRLHPLGDTEELSLTKQNTDMGRILTCDELVSSNRIYFAATGIGGGTLLPGVKIGSREAETFSLVLRNETATRRKIQTVHTLKRG